MTRVPAQALALGLGLAALTVPRQALGWLVDRCGVYAVEGRYEEISSPVHEGEPRKAILLDRGARSQVRFYITSPGPLWRLPDSFLDTDLRFRLRFTSPCFYHCAGEVVEIVEPLDPLEDPAPFQFPRPEPEAGSESPCEANPFEPPATPTQKEPG